MNWKDIYNEFYAPHTLKKENYDSWKKPDPNPVFCFHPSGVITDFWELYRVKQNNHSFTL